MTKKYVPLALLGFLVITNSACNAQNSGFKKTPNGLEYKIVKDAPGDQKPAVGDYMEFHIKSYVRFPKKDSMIFDSRAMNNNQPVPYQLMPASFKGDLAEGFMMLTAGDSAVFRISVDSVLKAGNQLLPWMQKGKDQKIEYAVKVVSVKNQAQMQADQKAASEKQVGADDQLIQKYLASNNIKAQKTASGLYYKIDNPGTGANAQPGQSVTVNYTGKTLEGKAFDSNVDPQFQHVQPFTFPLGMGQVIRGWDEGVGLLKKGGKATLYIPSGLAYGAQSPSPLIPANSVLVFDVEVTDIADAKAPEAPASPMQSAPDMKK